MPPLGRVRHPLLFSLFTHECTATHGSNPIVKFADDTVVVGLIKDNNKAAYWSKVKELSFWCKNNNLDLNISRWKGQRTQHEPLKIYGTKVEIVSSCKFLAVHISENLTWSTHTTMLVKKARQHLFDYFQIICSLIIPSHKQVTTVTQRDVWFYPFIELKLQ